MTKVGIFSFSASGNTAYLVRAVAEGLKQSGCQVTIADIEKPEWASPRWEDFDLIGVAFPVFAFRAPLITQNWIKQLSPPERKTPGFILGSWGGIEANARFWTEKKLAAKNIDIIWNSGRRCEDSYPVLRRWWTHPFIIRNVPGEKDFITAKDRWSKDILARLGKKEPPLRVRYRWWWILLDLIMPLYHATIGWWMKKWVKKPLCTRCGLCWRYCPVQIIHPDAEGYPRVKDRHCIGCYRCVNICPAGAFRSWFTGRGYRYDRMLTEIKKKGEGKP